MQNHDLTENLSSELQIRLGTRLYLGMSDKQQAVVQYTPYI